MRRASSHADLSNETESLLLPPLLARLRREVAGVRLMVKVASRDTLPAMLDEGVIDRPSAAWTPAHLAPACDTVCRNAPFLLQSEAGYGRRLSAWATTWPCRTP